MIFSELIIDNNEIIYVQIKNFIKDIIKKGILSSGSKLPSTRELSKILRVSRNSVVSAYEELEVEGYLHSLNGKGTFVTDCSILQEEVWQTEWKNKFNDYAILSEELDIVKNELPWKKGMISFKSIAPDEELFDIDEFKRAFLNRISLEGGKLLNYGYAKGYKPLIDYLIKYMGNKGVDFTNKDLIITNGFTEGFDIVLTALTQKGDTIICENPTHNTAIKLMKMHGINIVGVNMEPTGMDLSELNEVLTSHAPKFGYFIPSYHNPTGLVMTGDKRIELYNLFRHHRVPVIEDGFNEELLYTGSHLSPLISLSGTGNSIIYIGSFSKVLFPGIRVGWIVGDKKLIGTLESVKRARNIHTSFLDQAILFDYLQSGMFDKYIKKIRKKYSEKYEYALKCVKKYIPYKDVYGEGGLHLFIRLEGINTREVLMECVGRGVIFTPGDIFYHESNQGTDTLRIGFSRLSLDNIESGIITIGYVVNEIIKRKNV